MAITCILTLQSEYNTLDLQYVWCNNVQQITAGVTNQMHISRSYFKDKV
jgi:hypothetical protein